MFIKNVECHFILSLWVTDFVCYQLLSHSISYHTCILCTGIKSIGVLVYLYIIKKLKNSLDKIGYQLRYTAHVRTHTYIYIIDIIYFNVYRHTDESNVRNNAKYIFI